MIIERRIFVDIGAYLALFYKAVQRYERCY
jgi:hypothetical protein